MAVICTSCSDINAQKRDVDISGYALIFLNKPMFIYSSPSKADGLTASYRKSMLPTVLQTKMQDLQASTCVALIAKLHLIGIMDKSASGSSKEILVSKVSNFEAVGMEERDNFLENLNSAALNQKSVCVTK